MTGSVADSSALQVSISSETVIQTDSLVVWVKVQGSFITGEKERGHQVWVGDFSFHQ